MMSPILTVVACGLFVTGIKWVDAGVGGTCSRGETGYVKDVVAVRDDVKVTRWMKCVPAGGINDRHVYEVEKCFVGAEELPVRTGTDVAGGIWVKCNNGWPTVGGSLDDKVRCEESKPPKPVTYLVSTSTARPLTIVLQVISKNEKLKVKECAVNGQKQELGKPVVVGGYYLECREDAQPRYGKASPEPESAKL